MSSIVITFKDKEIQRFNGCEITYDGAFAIVRCPNGDQEIWPANEIKKIKVYYDEVRPEVQRNDSKEQG